MAETFHIFYKLFLDRKDTKPDREKDEKEDNKKNEAHKSELRLKGFL